MADWEEHTKTPASFYFKKISNLATQALLYLYLYDKKKNGVDVFNISKIASDLKINRCYLYQMVVELKAMELVSFVNRDRTIKFILSSEVFESEAYRVSAKRCLELKNK